MKPNESLAPAPLGTLAGLLRADAELLFGFPLCLYPAVGARLPVHGNRALCPYLETKSTLLCFGHHGLRGPGWPLVRMWSAAGLEPATYGRSIQLSSTRTESVAGLEPATYRRSLQLSFTQTSHSLLSVNQCRARFPGMDARDSRRRLPQCSLIFMRPLQALERSAKMVLGSGVEGYAAPLRPSRSPWPP